MRQVALALLLASPLLATGCNKNSAENASANFDAVDVPHYTVMPGPVTGSRAAGINATFRFMQATGPDPDSGITWGQYGGACIVFRAKDLLYTDMAGKQCASQADCDTGEGQGYCEESTKQCWARPNPVGDTDPYCRRSIDTSPPQQWQPNTDIPISENPIPIPEHLQANAQALTIACLKGKGKANVCGAPHSIVKWGSPSTIP